jgi:hypothetical protein
VFYGFIVAAASTRHVSRCCILCHLFDSPEASRTPPWPAHRPADEAQPGSSRSPRCGSSALPRATRGGAHLSSNRCSVRPAYLHHPMQILCLPAFADEKDADLEPDQRWIEGSMPDAVARPLMAFPQNRSPSRRYRLLFAIKSQSIQGGTRSMLSAAASLRNIELDLKLPQRPRCDEPQSDRFAAVFQAIQ